MTNCPNCGKKLIGKERFCTRCGIPVLPNLEIISEREGYTLTKDSSSNSYTTYLKDFSIKAGIEASMEIFRRTSRDLRKSSNKRLEIQGIELDKNEEDNISIESHVLYFADGLFLYRHFPNRLGDAIACFDKVIQLNPYHAEAWLYRGQILLEGAEVQNNRKPKHFNFRQLELALKSFDSVLDLSLEYDVEQQTIIKALIGKSSTLITMKRRDDAITCIKQVLELDPKNKQAQDLNSRLTPPIGVVVKYEELPVPILANFYAYVETINFLKGTLLGEETLVFEKDFLIKDDKERLIHYLPDRTEELVSFIQNISEVEECEKLIDIVGKPFSIHYKKDRTEKVGLETLLMKDDDDVQILPYDELIIYLSFELSKKDKPKKQLNIKHPGGIQLKDVEYALDLIPLRDNKEDHIRFSDLRYLYDYKGIPVYFCYTVFVKYIHESLGGMKKVRNERINKNVDQNKVVKDYYNEFFDELNKRKKFL